jgi:putative transposase
MKRVRCTEEQIIAVLREHGWGEDGRPGAQERHFGSDTVQLEGQVRWPGRFRGKRLRLLEGENRKLKKLLAESMPDNAALKKVWRGWKPRPLSHCCAEALADTHGRRAYLQEVTRAARNLCRSAPNLSFQIGGKLGNLGRITEIIPYPSDKHAKGAGKAVIIAAIVARHISTQQKPRGAYPSRSCGWRPNWALSDSVVAVTSAGRILPPSPAYGTKNFSSSPARLKASAWYRARPPGELT